MLLSAQRNTYPKIGRSGVKVKKKLLRRRADGHLAEVFRVILLVLGANSSRLCALLRRLLDQRLDHRGATTNGNIAASKTTLVQLVGMIVRPRFGWLESEPIEEVDVRLGTVRLVVLIRQGPNLGQTTVESDLGLSFIDGLHDCSVSMVFSSGYSTIE